jgi:hypothetical protein
VAVKANRRHPSGRRLRVSPGVTLRCWCAAATVACLLGLAACQGGIQVGVLNRCGHTLEAQADQAGWATVSAGKREHLVTLGEKATQMDVQVRRSKNEPTTEFGVPIADLPKPPAGVDEDIELTLQGDRCPR